DRVGLRRLPIRASSACSGGVDRGGRTRVPPPLPLPGERHGRPPRGLRPVAPGELPPLQAPAPRRPFLPGLLARLGGPVARLDPLVHDPHRRQSRKTGFRPSFRARVASSKFCVVRRTNSWVWLSSSIAAWRLPASSPAHIMRLVSCTPCALQPLICS